MQVLAVSVGGFIGASFRYLIGTLIISPFSTFIVNIVGSFILAWFLTIVTKRKNFSPIISLGFGTGLLGSFTTFSTFSVDILQLHSSILYSLLYCFGTIVVGLLCSYAGYKVALNERK